MSNSTARRVRVSVLAACVGMMHLPLLVLGACDRRVCARHAQEQYCVRHGTEEYQEQVGTRPAYVSRDAPPVIDVPTSTLGVFPFTDSSGHPGAGDAVANAIESWLFHDSRSRYVVFNRTQLQSVLSERQLAAQALDRDARRELEQADMSLDYIISGHVSQFDGPHVGFTLKVIKVETAAMVYMQDFSDDDGLAAVVGRAMDNFVPHQEQVEVGQEPVYETRTRESSSCAEEGTRQGNCEEWKTESDCFVATASGVSDPVTNILRSYRDRVLVANQFGSRFIELYRFYGPEMARVIRDDEPLRQTVRGVVTSFATEFLSLATGSGQTGPHDISGEEEDGVADARELVALLTEAAERLRQSEDPREYIGTVTSWLDGRPDRQQAVLRLLARDNIERDLCLALERNIRAVNLVMGFELEANVGICQ